MALFGIDDTYDMEEGRLGQRIFKYAVDRYGVATRRNRQLQNQFAAQFNRELKNGVSMKQAILGAFVSVGFASSYATSIASGIYNQFARQFESPDNVESFPDLQQGETMAKRQLRYDEDEDMELAVNVSNTLKAPESNVQRASTGPGGVGRGTTETTITPAKPQYGLRDTHTVALPMTNYFTLITNPEKDSSQEHFSFRLNSLFDVFKSSFDTAVPGDQLTQGLFQTLAATTQYTTTNDLWPNPSLPFYNSFNSGTSERPQWLLYFERMYRYYTVLGVEWKITFVNHMRNLNADLLIGYGKESTSATNTGDVFPKDAPISYMQHWPQLSWKVLPGRADGITSITSIGGYHKTGDAKRLVANDADVNTWTVMSQVPTYDESMVVWVSKGPFNDINETIPGVCGVKLELRFVAQLKDLQNAYMYPASQTSIVQTVPSDILQT